MHTNQAPEGKRGGRRGHDSVAEAPRHCISQPLDRGLPGLGIGDQACNAWQNITECVG